MNSTTANPNAATPITVLFAFDENYARHAAACIASLLHHSPSSFDIVLATTIDPAPFAARFDRSFGNHPRIAITWRRFQPPADLGFPLPNHLTLETYLRFWIGDLLPGRPRALYLDPDTILTTAVEPLWNTHLQGRVLGAVPIPGSTRPETHAMPPGSPFFNAGVLLIDLEAWRERGYLRRCLAYLARHPERALDGDQDILNLVTIGDWHPLPFEWNVISPFYRRTHDLKLPAPAVQAILRDARIVHYNGVNKPWNYLDDHPRKADYLANLARTDWRDWRPRDRTPLNILRKHLGAVTPPSAKSWLRRLLAPR